MENFFTRYKNPLVLMAVLVIQVIALATQIKRSDNARGGSEGTRLIRIWAVTAMTPFERVLLATGHFFRNTWHNYVDLHDVRRQNRELHEEIERMRLEQVRLHADSDQSRRLRALLDFKEHYIGQTVAAQVIGTSGNQFVHTIQIDKGSHHGVGADMAVITPDGIVGKVKEVFPFSSLVLMINDRESGAGVILEGTRLQGILRGKDIGELRVNDILSDEKDEITKGVRVITSGGDRIYPKGLPVGTVTDVGIDPESPFLAIAIKPAADLNRLEEVLVVTKIAEQAPESAGDESRRAADILAQRLPTIPKKPADSATPPAAGGAGPVTAQPTPKKNSGTATNQTPQPIGQAGLQKPVKTGEAEKKTGAAEPKTGAADTKPGGADQKPSDVKPRVGDASAKPAPTVNPNRKQPASTTAEKPPQ
jgi:rod shape-determining protein MreC